MIGKPLSLREENNHFEKLDRSKLKTLYKALFFVNISVALIAYVQSSFLNEIVNEKYVSLLFSLAGLITLFVVFLFTDFVRKVGGKSSLMIILILDIVSLLFLTASSPWIKILAFIAYSVISILLWIVLDIFIETCSTDNLTGRIRGITLTIINLGWVFSPILSGFLIQRFNFSAIFLISASLLCPFVIIFQMKFKNSKDDFNHPPKFRDTFKEILTSPALSRIFVIAFLLSFFYAWMVVYTPLYLINMGFDWKQIGQIFSVMLLPFVLFQYLGGWLADKFYGEKELLSFGIIVMALSTGALFFVQAKAMWLWMILLFITRVGAAVIEIMRDSYFFKQIDKRDVHLINFFRNTNSLAYLIAPLVAMIILVFFSLQWLFLFLGLIILSGLIFSLSLPDTR